MSINASFHSGMADFIFKAKSTIAKIETQALLEVGRRIVERSVVGNPALWHPPRWPKDYEPGHFINNWQLGIDAIPSSEIDGSDSTGSASIERMSHFGRWPVGHTYYFVNNLPYARKLEDGTWTVQAKYQVPQGIVGKTAMEFRQIVREAVMKHAKG